MEARVAPTSQNYVSFKLNYNKYLSVIDTPIINLIVKGYKVIAYKAPFATMLSGLKTTTNRDCCFSSRDKDLIPGFGWI